MRWVRGVRMREIRDYPYLRAESRECGYLFSQAKQGANTQYRNVHDCTGVKPSGLQSSLPTP
jgi:hypothetical protein